MDLWPPLVMKMLQASSKAFNVALGPLVDGRRWPLLLEAMRSNEVQCEHSIRQSSSALDDVLSCGGLSWFDE